MNKETSTNKNVQLRFRDCLTAILFHIFLSVINGGIIALLMRCAEKKKKI